MIEKAYCRCPVMIEVHPTGFNELVSIDLIVPYEEILRL